VELRLGEYKGWAAEVMILGWPMEADEFLNATLLVEDHGLAVRVCDGGSTVPAPNEFVRIWIMSESINGNIPEKQMARVMREKALECSKSWWEVKDGVGGVSERAEKN